MNLATLANMVAAKQTAALDHWRARMRHAVCSPLIHSDLPSPGSDAPLHRVSRGCLACAAESSSKFAASLASEATHSHAIPQFLVTSPAIVCIPKEDGGTRPLTVLIVVYRMWASRAARILAEWFGSDGIALGVRYARFMADALWSWRRRHYAGKILDPQCLTGEADGPRPVWSRPEGYKVEDGRLVAVAPDEARGYFRYIRDSTEEVTENPPMWPPPPRKRGDLDFPSGPIPTVEIYAEHHIADTDKANAAWKEQFELHEAKQPKIKLIDMSRREPDVKGSDEQEANNAFVPRYTSPNADNIVPEEERTGLEKRLVLSHFSARYAKTSDVENDDGRDPAEKLGEEAREIVGNVPVTVAQDMGNLRARFTQIEMVSIDSLCTVLNLRDTSRKSHVSYRNDERCQSALSKSTKVLRADRDFEPESELAVKKNPWYRDVDSAPASADAAGKRPKKCADALGMDIRQLRFQWFQWLSGWLPGG
eukprot:s719_g7.t1